MKPHKRRRLKKWVAARLREKTTYVGLLGLLLALGAKLSPELQAAILGNAILVGSMLAIWFEETPEPPKNEGATTDESAD